MIEILVISSNVQNLFSNSSATRGIPLFFSGNGANTAIFMIGYKLDSAAVDSGRTLSTEICKTKKTSVYYRNYCIIILESDEQVVSQALFYSCNGFSHPSKAKTRLIAIE